MTPFTVGAALKAASQRLRQKAIAGPIREAFEILAGTLKKDRSVLLAHPERILSLSQLRQFQKKVEERANHTPFAYLFSLCDFYHFSLYVDRRVLIPRPETEILVEQFIKKFERSKGLKFLDLGTGSGCIALALGKELPSKIWATDISKQTLAVARHNINNHQLQKKVILKQGNLFRPFDPRKYKNFFDGVISNPPYVSSMEISRLMPEVKKEPRIALTGGPQGLRLLKKICSQANPYLKPGGWLGLEIGIGQKKKVELWLKQKGFLVESHKDYRGIDRVVLAQKVEQ